MILNAKIENANYSWVIIDQPSGKFDLCLLGYAARALKKREQKPEGDRHALFL